MNERLKAMSFPLPLGTHIKWTMNSSTHFTADHKDFNCIVSKSGSRWIWQIVQDGLIVGAAFHHPCAPTSELDAKVKCERRLNVILEQST